MTTKKAHPVSNSNRKSDSDVTENTSAALRKNAGLLLLSLLVLGLAVLLSTDGTHVFVSLNGYSLEAPSVCPLRNSAGIDCAGCGLTRSFIALANGNLTASFAFHRIGFLLFLAILVQIPYRTYLIIAHFVQWTPHYLPTNRLIQGLIALLILNWLVKLITGNV